jgi:hypothetical protein
MRIMCVIPNPIMGSIMSGFLPFVSDQGPMKRQRMMPGKDERMELYMTIVVTIV